jgi:hypothetical protein
MRSLCLAALVTIAAIAAACGEEATEVPEQPRPASIAELTGPWRPQPFTLDPVLRERIAEACRRPPMRRGPGSVLAVIDARGGGLVTVRMTGVDAGECSGIAISPDGELIPAGGGSVFDQVEVAPKLRDFQLGPLEVSGGAGGDFLPVDGLVNVFGTAGPGIATVVIEPVGRPSLVASLENGWFAAWWPITLDEAPDGARLPPGAFDFVVQAYDENNDVVEETRNWEVLN